MISARKRQHGSAFFIILIAIMMFGMLSYAVSQGSRSGASSLNKEQLQIAAQEISDFGNTFAKSVQTLRLRGCTAEQISFESMPVAGNENPVSPSDGSCDVFSLAGGKATYTPPSSNWLNTADMGKDGYQEWFFTNRSCIPGVGTGGASCGNASEMEIIMVLPWVRQDLCDAYNKYVGWRNYETDPIPGEAGTAYNYGEKVDGVFQNGSNINTWDNMMNADRTLCFRGAGSEPDGGYHIYFVLLAR